MRNGFSTSACAAAAVSAGIECLITGVPVLAVSINLPARRLVQFNLLRCERVGDGVLCGVQKDAGDDPDVTNGLEIQALVEFTTEPGQSILGGKGVGRVTLPGLPLPVGESAINPGSRRLIQSVIRDTLQTFHLPLETGIRITVIVPEGERIAVETMNPKLGIIGGISILGTDGLVRPYSASAFKTSIHLEMNVAITNGYKTIGLATGKRSAEYLRQYLRDEKGLGVLDVGDELEYPLKQIRKFKFDRVVLGGMIGKFSKVAQGRFQTHVQEGEVDFAFLSEIAARVGAPSDVCDRILTARTAHQVQTWLKDLNLGIETELATRAMQFVADVIGAGIGVTVLIYSLNGVILGEVSYG